MWLFQFDWLGGRNSLPLHEPLSNRRVSASYGAAMVLAALFLLFGRDVRTLLLSVAAVILAVLFVRTGHLSLLIHSTVYLLVACFVGDLFAYAGSALAGTVPGWPLWGFWPVLVASLVIYSLETRFAGEREKARILWLMPVSIAALAITSLIVAAVSSFAGELTASRLSMVRTVATCLMALGPAYTGSRCNRVELGWVAYGAIGWEPSNY